MASPRSRSASPHRRPSPACNGRSAQFIVFLADYHEGRPLGGSAICWHRSGGFRGGKRFGVDRASTNSRALLMSPAFTRHESEHLPNAAAALTCNKDARRDEGDVQKKPGHQCDREYGHHAKSLLQTRVRPPNHISFVKRTQFLAALQRTESFAASPCCRRQRPAMWQTA